MNPTTEDIIIDAIFFDGLLFGPGVGASTGIITQGDHATPPSAGERMLRGRAMNALTGGGGSETSPLALLTGASRQTFLRAK